MRKQTTCAKECRPPYGLIGTACSNKRAGAAKFTVRSQHFEQGRTKIKPEEKKEAVVAVVAF